MISHVKSVTIEQPTHVKGARKHVTKVVDPYMNTEEQDPVESDDQFEDEVNFHDLHPSWINSQIHNRAGF